MTTKKEIHPIYAEAEHPKRKKGRLGWAQEKRICHGLELKFKRLFEGLV